MGKSLAPGAMPGNRITYIPTIDSEIEQFLDAWDRRLRSIDESRAAIARFKAQDKQIELAAETRCLAEWMRRRQDLIKRPIARIRAQELIIEAWREQLATLRKKGFDEAADRMEWQIGLAIGKRAKWVAVLAEIAPDRAAAVAS